MYLLEIDGFMFGTANEFSPVINENYVPVLPGRYMGDDLTGYNVLRGRESITGSFVLLVHDQQLRGLEPYLPGLEFLGSFDRWWVLRDRKNGRPFTLTVYEVEGKGFRLWEETKKKLFEFYNCLIDQDHPEWKSFTNTIPHWSEPTSFRLPFVFADCEINYRQSDCEVAAR